MYCPTCGTQNADGASFCRLCGANVSLIPQALAGQVPAAPEAGAEVWHGRRRKVPSIEKAVMPFFGGLGFFLVAVTIMLFLPGGLHWGFWLFIPSFFMMGSGAAEYLKLRQYQRDPARTAAVSYGAAPPGVAPAAHQTAPLPAAHAAPALTPREQPAAYAPGSVTEGTTKLLERDE